jgi:hypothetical protein
VYLLHLLLNRVIHVSGRFLHSLINLSGGRSSAHRREMPDLQTSNHKKPSKARVRLLPVQDLRPVLHRQRPQQQMRGPGEETFRQPREVLAMRNLRKNGGAKTSPHPWSPPPVRGWMAPTTWASVDSREAGAGQKGGNQSQKKGKYFFIITFAMAMFCTMKMFYKTCILNSWTALKLKLFTYLYRSS